MARKRQHRKGGPRVWTPMRRGELSPSYVELVYPDGFPEGCRSVEVWANDLYEAVAESFENGWVYITLKRRDRKAVRDWRHLQSIKNEVVGREREAFELFPAESRLMDAANQYHLWVLPAGERYSFGWHERQVLDGATATSLRVRGIGKGRQRPFQPGLSTGPQGDETARAVR